MEERYAEIKGALKARMRALTEYRYIREAKFNLGSVAGNPVDPGYDDASWQDIILPLNWDNTQDAWFRIEAVVPEKVDEISVGGSEMKVRGKSVWANPVLNMHGQLYIDGEMVMEAANWFDLSFFNLVADGVKPGDRHTIAVHTEGKEGVVVYYSALPEMEIRYSNVDEKQIEIEAFLQEIRFAEGLPDGTAVLDGVLKGSGRDEIMDMPLETLIEFIHAKEEEMTPLKKAAKEHEIYLAGYAHIDMNWLWPMDETIELCRATAESVDRVMTEHNELCYTQSQAFTYKAMETQHPEYFEMIKRRFEEGIWEIAAPAWVELDLNMANGEAIAHQILLSKRYLKEKFGNDPKLFLSPDTFGHPWTLPQILKKSGISYYYFMRSSDPDRDIFWWQGPDGSRVLAFNSSYLGGMNSEILVDVAQFYRNTLGLKRVMYVYGIGDHGGGPTLEDGRLVKILQTKPIYPTLRYSTMERYYEILEKEKVDLPVSDGEINFVFDGCYTTHWDTKVHNRTCERLLLEAENVGVVSLLHGGRYPDLQEGWEITMLNQFHDILPGSGIRQTYEVPNAQAEKVEAFCEKSISEGLSRIAGMVERKKEGRCVLVFNNLSWKRTGAVRIGRYPECPSSVVIKDEDGREYPAQTVGDDIVFVAEDVPSFGYRVFYICEGMTEGPDIVNGRFVLENEKLAVKLDPGTGTIASVYDKAARRNVMEEMWDEGAYPTHTFPLKTMTIESVIPTTRLVRNNDLQVHLEEPHGMSAWVIGPVRQISSLVEGAEVELVANGPVMGAVRVTKRYNKSVITQDIVLYRGVDRIDFDTTIEWGEKAGPKELSPMLKASFTPSLGRTKATYEIPYGSIERNADGREVPALQWADLSDDEYGMSILTDTKYGFDAKGNTMRITLIRTSYEPDPDPDRGTHSFVYSLYPHKGGWKQAHSERKGYELNHPLRCAWCEKEGGSLPGTGSFIDVEAKSAVMTCVKKEEGKAGIILRFYESQGKNCSVKVDFGFDVKRAEETDIIERPVNQAACDVKANVMRFDLKPYEIKTFRVDR
ncbi:MAG: alpha-mannosidase [Spirochaetes bacterium]|nr:alpha-mannosidase [Spirochaetota bacterium]